MRHNVLVFIDLALRHEQEIIARVEHLFSQDQRVLVTIKLRIVLACIAFLLERYLVLYLLRLGFRLGLSLNVVGGPFLKYRTNARVKVELLHRTFPQHLEPFSDALDRRVRLRPIDDMSHEFLGEPLLIGLRPFTVLDPVGFFYRGKVGATRHQAASDMAELVHEGCEVGVLREVDNRLRSINHRGRADSLCCLERLGVANLNKLVGHGVHDLSERPTRGVRRDLHEVEPKLHLAAAHKASLRELQACLLASLRVKRRSHRRLDNRGCPKPHLLRGLEGFREALRGGG